MQLTGELKEKDEIMDQKENIEIKEEKINEEAGMILSDDELDQVSGGGKRPHHHHTILP